MRISAPKPSNFSAKELKKSKTVFWNGPMGVDEIPQFAKGTETLAKLLPGLKATTIMGGGSTARLSTPWGWPIKSLLFPPAAALHWNSSAVMNCPAWRRLMDKE